MFMYFVTNSFKYCLFYVHFCFWIGGLELPTGDISEKHRCSYLGVITLSVDTLGVQPFSWGCQSHYDL